MNTSLKTLVTLISLAVCTAVPVARGADTTGRRRADDRQTQQSD
jgi:hypothetical protein